MSTEERSIYRDRLREMIEEMLQSGGDATVLTSAVMLVRDPELDRLSQENDRLSQENDRLAADLQSRIDDHAATARFVGEQLGLNQPLPAVTSIGCAKALAEEFTDRAESAEARLAEAQKKIEDLSSLLLNAAADKLDALPAGGEALNGPQWYRQGVSDAANCLRDWADSGAIKINPPPGDTP